MEGFEIKYTGPRRRYRVRFERRSVGGWDRTVEEFRDGRWRQVGAEPVGEVSVEIDDTALDSVAVVFPDADPVEVNP